MFEQKLSILQWTDILDKRMKNEKWDRSTYCVTTDHDVSIVKLSIDG